MLLRVTKLSKSTSQSKYKQQRGFCGLYISTQRDLMRMIFSVVILSAIV